MPLESTLLAQAEDAFICKGVTSKKDALNLIGALLVEIINNPPGGGGGGGAWGGITGTLSDQTDLQSALDAKEPAQTAASQAEAEAGTETALRSFSPLRIKQAIDSLGGGSLLHTNVAHIDTAATGTKDGSPEHPYATLAEAVAGGFTRFVLGVGSFGGATLATGTYYFTGRGRGATNIGAIVSNGVNLTLISNDSVTIASVTTSGATGAWNTNGGDGGNVTARHLHISGDIDCRGGAGGPASGEGASGMAGGSAGSATLYDSFVDGHVYLQGGGGSAGLKGADDSPGGTGGNGGHAGSLTMINSTVGYNVYVQGGGGDMGGDGGDDAGGGGGNAGDGGTGGAANTLAMTHSVIQGAVAIDSGAGAAQNFNGANPGAPGGQYEGGNLVMKHSSIFDSVTMSGDAGAHSGTIDLVSSHITNGLNYASFGSIVILGTSINYSFYAVSFP